MPTINEVQFKAHNNIYTDSERSIPALISIPSFGVNENTSLLVISYAYGATYHANVFKKMMLELSDEYNIAVVSGYYFGAKYMGNDISVNIDLNIKNDDPRIYSNLLLTPIPEESRDEFNDMCIMQALDTVYTALGALDYIGKKSHELKHIIGFGSSHGAYLCHLANIMCPDLFTYILDNSGYLFPFYYNRFRDVSYKLPFGILNIGWLYLVNNQPELQVDPDLMDLQYLYQTSQNKCKIIVFQGIDDYMVDYRQKQSFVDCVGADCAEMMLFEPKDIDNTFITTVDHGLGMNFLVLFRMILPMIQPQMVDRTPLSDATVNIGNGKLLLSYRTGYPVVEYIQMKLLPPSS